MPDRTFLEWPFFDDGHRAFAAAIDAFAVHEAADLVEGAERDADAVYRCVRGLVRALGDAGLLRMCVPAAVGGTRERVAVGCGSSALAEPRGEAFKQRAGGILIDVGHRVLLVCLVRW